MSEVKEVDESEWLGDPHLDFLILNPNPFFCICICRWIHGVGLENIALDLLCIRICGCTIAFVPRI